MVNWNKVKDYEDITFKELNGVADKIDKKL